VDDSTELPASIQAAWGLRTRAGKGPKPGLSLSRIVEAAVRIALSDGLAAVSMNRLAGDLGTSPMSLYRYFSAKDELLVLMVDAASGVPPAAEPGEDWRAGLTRWAWGYLNALRRHPWIVRVPISAPPLTPNQIVWLEDGLRALRDTSLGAQEKMSVILMLSGFVRSWATLTADMMAAALAAGNADAIVGYGTMLARLIDPARFPEVHKVVVTGVLDDEDGDLDGEFVFGLGRVLDGVEALTRGRTGEAAGAARTGDAAGAARTVADRAEP
jgi:AcrR family transcriptional regulator